MKLAWIPSLPPSVQFWQLWWTKLLTRWKRQQGSSQSVSTFLELPWPGRLMWQSWPSVALQWVCHWQHLATTMGNVQACSHNNVVSVIVGLSVHVDVKTGNSGVISPKQFLVKEVPGLLCWKFGICMSHVYNVCGVLADPQNAMYIQALFLLKNREPAMHVHGTLLIHAGELEKLLTLFFLYPHSQMKSLTSTHFHQMR